MERLTTNPFFFYSSPIRHLGLSVSERERVLKNGSSIPECIYVYVVVSQDRAHPLLRWALDGVLAIEAGNIKNKNNTSFKSLRFWKELT